MMQEKKRFNVTNSKSRQILEDIDSIRKLKSTEQFNSSNVYIPWTLALLLSLLLIFGLTWITKTTSSSPNLQPEILNQSQQSGNNTVQSK